MKRNIALWLAATAIFPTLAQAEPAPKASAKAEEVCAPGDPLCDEKPRTSGSPASRGQPQARRTPTPASTAAPSDSNPVRSSGVTFGSTPSATVSPDGSVIEIKGGDSIGGRGIRPEDRIAHDPRSEPRLMQFLPPEQECQLTSDSNPYYKEALVAHYRAQRAPGTDRPLYLFSGSNWRELCVAPKPQPTAQPDESYAVNPRREPKRSMNGDWVNFSTAGLGAISVSNDHYHADNGDMAEARGAVALHENRGIYISRDWLAQYKFNGSMSVMPKLGGSGDLLGGLFTKLSPGECGPLAGGNFGGTINAHGGNNLQTQMSTVTAEAAVGFVCITPQRDVVYKATLGVPMARVAVSKWREQMLGLEDRNGDAPSRRDVVHGRGLTARFDIINHANVQTSAAFEGYKYIGGARELSLDLSADARVSDSVYIGASVNVRNYKPAAADKVGNEGTEVAASLKAGVILERLLHKGQASGSAAE